MILLQPFLVLVLVVGEIELAFEALDHLLGELHLGRADLAAHFAQLVDLIDGADLGGVVQRVHHQSLLVRLDGDERLASVNGDLADADLALHAVAHHGIGIGRHRAVGHEVIGLVDVHRIDLVVAGELHQVDDLGRFGPDLGDVLVVITTQRPFSNS